MPESNKEVVRKLFDRLFSKGDRSVIEEVIAPDCTFHHPGMTTNPLGPAGLEHIADIFFTAFPDLRASMDEMVAEGDSIAVRWTSTGTHEGELMGIAPTGRKVEFTGMNLFHLKDGKISEWWSSTDELGIMRQIGAEPPLREAAD